MICPYCGKENKERQDWCAYCGEMLDWVEDDSPKPIRPVGHEQTAQRPSEPRGRQKRAHSRARKKTNMRVLILIVSLVLVVGIGGLIAVKLLNPKSSNANDPFIGAWHDPWSVSGEYDSYTVIADDGSFMFATNWYTGDGFIEQVLTKNETFHWRKTGENQYELRYDYLDGNGEFTTELIYNPEYDSLYVGGSIYGNRDTSFFINDY